MNSFVPVITTDDARAHIIAGMLENNGIRCNLTPDSMSSIFPIPDSSISTVTVYVDEADAKHAAELVEEFDG